MAKKYKGFKGSGMNDNKPLTQREKNRIMEEMADVSYDAFMTALAKVRGKRKERYINL